MLSLVRDHFEHGGAAHFRLEGARVPVSIGHLMLCHSKLLASELYLRGVLLALVKHQSLGHTLTVQCLVSLRDLYLHLHLCQFVAEHQRLCFLGAVLLLTLLPRCTNKSCKCLGTSKRTSNSSSSTCDPPSGVSGIGIIP